MRVFELAAAHSVSVDTVRYYQKIGLLHPPTRRGRVAVYDESHDQRLGEIRRLSEAGFSLAQIRQLGDGADEPMLVALGARRDDTLSFEELVQQSGLDPELVRLAADTGLVRPLRGSVIGADAESGTPGPDGAADEALYSTGALTMLRAAAELLGAEMPLDDLVGLALRHASNMEAVAADAVELFADRFAGVGAPERADLAARLIPLVTDLVAQHFRESLVEHATERVLAASFDEPAGPDLEPAATGPSQTGSPQTGSPQTGSPQTGSPQTGSPPTGSSETGVHAPRARRSRRSASAGPGSTRSVTLECRELAGALDPLAVFAAADAQQRAYWACPEGDLEFCALGSVFEASAEAGSGRFAAVSADLDMLDVTVTGDIGDPTGPLAVGGFSFSDEAGQANDPTWKAFGPGRLTVPELLLVRRGDRSWLTSAPAADLGPVMAAGRPTAESACATCGVADGSGICGLAATTGAPADTCGRGGAAQPGSSGTGLALENAAPAADPELAVTAAVDLNAAALALLGSSYRADDSYVALTRRALDRIAEGGLDKVVTARELSIASPLEPVAVLDRLRRRFPSCVTFAFGRGSQTYFGATPEQLVRSDGTRLSADALAGSRPRHGDPARDADLRAELQRDPKELTEHAMVVTDVRDTLRSQGVALDPPSPTGVMELPHIMHLHTPITGRVPAGTTVLELAGALHPTAAVAGLPRRVARDWISKHEHFDRGWYAAPIGWTTLDGRGEFRVGLRCALTGPSGTRLFAGGGIVTGADPDAELAETATKLEALLGALEDAEPREG